MPVPLSFVFACGALGVSKLKSQFSKNQNLIFSIPASQNKQNNLFYIHTLLHFAAACVKMVIGKSALINLSALHVFVASLRRRVFYFRVFPHSTPCVRFSPHTAFHRRILADLRSSLRYSLQVPSSLRPLLFSTGSAAYCSSSAYILIEDVQYLSSFR